MKKLSQLCALLFLISFMTACPGSKDKTTVDVIPEYQKAIDAKYKAIGWTDGPDNGNKATQTLGAKGWVQYYGSKTRAIYYFDGKAFAVEQAEMKKYDALGQDTYGLVSSDYVSLGTGAGYIEITRLKDNSAGIIITNPIAGTFLVDGPIYKRYLDSNRWMGPLGYPLMDEGGLTSKKGTYIAFSKTLNKNISGQIYWSESTGAQAFWGKYATMYGNTGYDTGWLGLPISSLNDSSVQNQVIYFQYGQISMRNECGRYIKYDANMAVNGSHYFYAYSNGTLTNDLKEVCY